MKLNFFVLILTITLTCLTGQSMAQDTAGSKLQSAGTLEFGDGNILFVGDSKAAVVHASNYVIVI